MSVNIGFNFRGSSGYVTDPANTTYSLGNTFEANYPITRAGYTFGWDPAGSGQVDFGVDRNSGNDPRLAGIVFYNGGPAATFQLDLPNAGTFDIYLAIGDAVGGTGLTTVTLKDNTTTLWSVTQASTTGNSFTDAQGNEYTAANWPANNMPQAATFATTTLRIVLGTSPAFQGLAHLAVVEQVGGGSPGPGSPSGNPWNAYAQQRIKTLLKRRWAKAGPLWTPSYA